MARVLLVGGSYSALPLAHVIRNLGHWLIVAGNDPAEPAHLLANESVFVDYSNLIRALPALSHMEPNYVVPSSNDRSYRAATLLAHALALPGYDTPETERLISVKSKFREVGECISLRAPRRVTTDAARAGFTRGTRVIVKPTDVFSGIGVNVAHDSDSLDSAVAAATVAAVTGDFIVEEFVHGTLHSHSMFVRDGNCAKDFFVDEFCTQFPYQVNSSNHPSHIATDIREAVRREMLKFVKHLGLVDGLLHTQFLLNDDGPWIVESMRRAPGDLYPSLVERSTGFDYSMAYVEPFLGRNTISEKTGCLNDVPVARHTISASERAEPMWIEFMSDSRAFEIVPLLSAGSRLEPAPHGKAGIAFLRFDTPEELWRRTPRLIDQFSIR